VKRPGDEEKHADIVVPSPTTGKAVTPAEVNQNTTSSSSSTPEKEAVSKKKTGKRDPALEGLEL
jgi:hypothetical protein